jgi:hypothetical protein
MKRAGCLVVAALAMGCVRAPRVPTPASAPVVVTVVVDQHAAWIAAERWPELPSTGGFARLRREGTWVRDARHEHACTDTAPGHATLYTGASPHDHGIFVNEVFSGHERVSVLRDEATRLVDDKGTSATPGSSIARLRVETIADRLKVEHPDALVVSLSLKDRGALFAAGRHPDAAVWFDPSREAFVTSTAIAASLPDFARREGSHQAIAASRPPWTPLDPAWLAAHAKTPDDQPGEGDWGGYGTTFPHDVTRAKFPGNAYRANPYADERLLAMARAALDDPRAGQVPTLLALSMSSNDYVAHVFGPDSWEAWDELYRLDAALGRFLGHLDQRFGPRGWSLVLSADHGAGSLPEIASIAATRPHCAPGADNRYQRPCTDGGRILLDELGKTLRDEATRVMGPGDWITGVADPHVFLGPSAVAATPEARAKLIAALVAVLAADPRVALVREVAKSPDVCPGNEDESVDALVCRAIPKGIESALYVATKPGVFFDSDYVPGKGASHGTPWLYDRAVPLLARAPGRVAEGVVDDVPVSTAAFSRTVAALLGVGAPSSAAAARSLVGIATGGDPDRRR